MTNQLPRRSPDDRTLGQDRYGQTWKERQDKIWERVDGKTSFRKPSGINPFGDPDTDKLYQDKVD